MVLCCIDLAVVLLTWLVPCGRLVIQVMVDLEEQFSTNEYQEEAAE